MKTKYSKFQIIIEILTVLLFISMIVFICSQWRNIPDQIPGHYNAMGQVDRWGNKNEILFLPLVAFLLYLLMTVLTFFPSIWNIPVQLNDDNKEAVYSSIKSMVILMKFEVIGIFFYLTVYVATAQVLPKAFTSVLMIILFGTVVFNIIRVFQLNKKKKT